MDSSGPSEKDIPFTARLMAHYRALESKRESPLFVDQFAESLAGDLTKYFAGYPRHSQQSDYPIVRSYYIDEYLLRPWCDNQENSQIVILGAGLDTRAYRFIPLNQHTHTVFEIDLPIIITYKEKILQHERSLCRLTRISADLSSPEWSSQLLTYGYSPKAPTFWIIEGLLYYMNRDTATILLRKIAEISGEKSQMFTDVCVPALAEAKFGAFMTHFRWGIDLDEIPSFFSETGWNVSASYADDHDQGRNVGQRGLMFVHGNLNVSESKKSMQLTNEVELNALDPNEIIRDIERIVDIYRNNRETGRSEYLTFIRHIREPLRTYAQKLNNPVAIGKISPRLLRDPLSSGIEDNLLSVDEEEGHIFGYLSAILILVYCIKQRIGGEQFPESVLYKEKLKLQGIKRIDAIMQLIDLVKNEIES